MIGPYHLPDYTTLIDNAEQYSESWRQLAKPVEEKLGLTLTAFDPDYIFTKGNPNGLPTIITLPVWFVRDLNKLLGAQ